MLIVYIGLVAVLSIGIGMLSEIIVYKCDLRK